VLIHLSKLCFQGILEVDDFDDPLFQQMLFESRSKVPKVRLDLSTWVRQLCNPVSLDRIAEANSVFTGVVIRGPCDHVNEEFTSLMGQRWAAKGIRLQEIDLSQCHTITDKSALNLVEVFPLLRSISLNCCSLISDRALSYISKYCPDLRCLEIAQCPRLTSMGLGQVVSKCKRVVAFNVAHCPSVTDRFLNLIR